MAKKDVYDLRKVLDELKKNLANIMKRMLKLIPMLNYQVFIVTLVKVGLYNVQPKKVQR